MIYYVFKYSSNGDFYSSSPQDTIGTLYENLAPIVSANMPSRFVAKLCGETEISPSFLHAAVNILFTTLLLYAHLSKLRFAHLSKSCGETGIRTPETLLEFTRFPGVPLQPLEHLSIACISTQRDCKSTTIFAHTQIFATFFLQFGLFFAILMFFLAIFLLCLL